MDVDQARGHPLHPAFCLASELNHFLEAHAEVVVGGVVEVVGARVNLARVVPEVVLVTKAVGARGA